MTDTHGMGMGVGMDMGMGTVSQGALDRGTEGLLLMALARICLHARLTGVIYYVD